MQEAKLHHYTVRFNNSDEYHRLKSEVFTQDSYYFETDNPEPVIIDAGAHIGLATLYFKKLYPGAKVIAIEPHPENFKLLEQNTLYSNQLDAIAIHNVALAANSGTIELHTDSTPLQWYSTSSFVNGAWNHAQTSHILHVPSQPLARFLTQPIDFLKMDIEGAEQEVLMAASDQIHLVKHMIVEFHPVEHQSLSKLVDWLAERHFNVTLWKDTKEVDLSHAKGLVLIEAELG
jgi:FkbM family methyltransferase